MLGYQKDELGLFELTGIRERASEILGLPADATTRAGVHRALRQRIENAAVQRQWLVQRGAEIISEASRRLDDFLKPRHPDIPW